MCRDNVFIVRVNVTDTRTMADNDPTPGPSSEPSSEPGPRVTEDPGPGPGGGQQQGTQGKPVCVIVLGMAGSGKTTFVQR